MSSFVPSLNGICLYTTAPPFDFPRSGQAFLSHEDTQHMAEKLLWLSPFVPSELPYLTGREDGHHTRPVVRFKLVWRIDQDKSVRLLTQRV